MSAVAGTPAIAYHLHEISDSLLPAGSLALAIRETALIDLTGKVLVATDREERLTGRLLPYRYVQQGLSGSPAISDLHFLNREADLTPA